LSQQALHRAAFQERRAEPPRGACKAGGDEVGVGKAGFGLVSDERGARRVAEVGDGQQRLRLLGADLVGLDAEGPLRCQRFAQRAGALTFRRHDEVAAAHQAAGGFGVVQVGGQVAEDRPGTLRQGDVFQHRVVRAQDAGGLRRSAIADPATLQQRHTGQAQAREVVGDGRADDATADDHCVEGLHAGITPAAPGGAPARRCGPAAGPRP
jgi:hypothetical protein